MSITRRFTAHLAIALMLLAAMPAVEATHPDLTVVISDADAERGEDTIGPAETGVAKTVTITNNDGVQALDKLILSAAGTGDDDITFTAVAGSCQVATGWTAAVTGSGQTLELTGGTLAASGTIAVDICFDVIGTPGNAATITITVDGQLVTTQHATGTDDLVVDATAPTITDADTSDESGNGRIDRLTVQLSEKVKASSVDVGEWNIAGYSKSSVTRHADGDKIVIDLLEGNDPDTGAKPVLTYVPSSTMEDLYGNKASASDTSITVNDKAAPKLMRATAALGTKTIDLEFSEGVKGTGTGGKLVKADLAYTEVDGEVQTITDVAHTSGAKTAVVTVDKTLTVSDIGPDDDMIGPTTSVEDVPGNDAITTQRIIEEATDDPPGPVTALSIVTADSTETSLKLQWDTPNENDLQKFKVARSTSAITNANFAAATQITTDVPALVKDSTQTMTITGLTAETTYHFAIRVVDDADQESNVATVFGATLAADSTAPTGTPTISSATHAEDTAVAAENATFTWTAATDDESPSTVKYHYALKAAADYTVTASDTSTTALTATSNEIADGTWYFYVRAASAGGLGEQDSYKIIVDSTVDDVEEEDPIISYQKKTVVTSKYTKDGNEVSWVLAGNPPETVQGVGVFVENSPVDIVVWLDKDDAEFKASKILHEGSAALKTSVYYVLPYFNTTLEKGYYSVEDLDKLDTTKFTGALTEFEEDEPFPLWGWILIVVGAVTVLALILVTILAATRRRRDQDGYDDGTWDEQPGGDLGWADDQDAWGEEQGDEGYDYGYEEAEPDAGYEPAPAAPPRGAYGVFNMQCPACSATFTAEGEKPLVTHCPNCDRKGVLN